MIHSPPCWPNINDTKRPVEDFLKSLNTTEEPTTYGKNGLDEMIFNVIVIHTASTGEWMVVLDTLMVVVVLPID